MGQMVLPKIFLRIRLSGKGILPGQVRPEGKLVKFLPISTKKELCLGLILSLWFQNWTVLVKITFAGPFDNQGRWKTSIFIFFNLWFSNFYLQKSFSIFSSRNFVQNFPSSNIFKLRISFLMIAISNWIYLRRDLFFLKIFCPPGGNWVLTLATQIREALESPAWKFDHRGRSQIIREHKYYHLESKI